jgi:hypothetical protein
VLQPDREDLTEHAAQATDQRGADEDAALAQTVPAESYPTLRLILGEPGFTELARLIRTTYEANEQRRRREPSEATWRDTGGQG